MTTTIKHIVLFEIKDGVDAASKQKLCDAMYALQSKCVHPTTKQPYIKSIEGGKDMSVEGMQQGHSYGFVVEFESTDHRDYYAKTDAAHRALIVEFITGPEAIVKGVTVVDYVPGAF